MYKRHHTKHTMALVFNFSIIYLVLSVLFVVLNVARDDNYKKPKIDLFSFFLIQFPSIVESMKTVLNAKLNIYMLISNYLATEQSINKSKNGKNVMQVVILRKNWQRHSFRFENASSQCPFGLFTAGRKLFIP